MNKHLNITIIGKVQGVWYRAYTQKNRPAAGVGGGGIGDNGGGFKGAQKGGKEKKEYENPAGAHRRGPY